MTPPVDGIVLLAKQSGITSFSSLWQVKNALGTKKIGHTGTLDTFAEGLLVALAGRYTRLVPYLSNSDKEYLAEIRFGVETDTLDPDGVPVAEGPLPTLQSVLDALPLFTGSIMQKPPSFSALRVNGQRASDLVRKGLEVEMKVRPIMVYDLDFLSAKDESGNEASRDKTVKTVTLRVVCSKGTYVRSLARDIASACGTCAHLQALRRTRTGPFSLERAAGFSLLSPFPPEFRGVYGVGEKPPQPSPAEILSATLPLTDDFARACGLCCVSLDSGFRSDFSHGKKPSPLWFTPFEKAVSVRDEQSNGPAAVFSGEDFMGVVSLSPNGARYEFVAEGAG
jgi:tRNA pseudouridine55 synthase